MIGLDPSTIYLIAMLTVMHHLVSPQISMSVRRTPVPVMKMQIAIIRTVPTAVPVDRDSLAMEQLVMVNLQKILVSTSQSSMCWNCSHENMLRSIMEINL